MLRFEHLTDHIGSEVFGLELDGPIETGVADALRAEFDARHLLVVRDQDVDTEAQRRFTALFGEVADEHLDGSMTAYVSNRRGDAIVPEGELHWHSDFTFTPWPLEAICLYGLEVRGAVSPTRYVSGARAYAALDQQRRREIDSMRAVHMADFSGAESHFGRNRYETLPDDPQEYPRTEHPVVREHARTGVPLLFVNEYLTARIVGQDAAGTAEVLDDLFAVLYDEQGVYEHQWRERDLVIWDNVALQHSRRTPSQEAGQEPATRTLRRNVVSPQYRQIVDLVPSLRASMVDRRRRSSEAML